MSETQLQALRMDEANALGTLLSMVSIMLIYHENGGEKPDHWARFRKAYDAYQARHGAVIDCICAGQAEPSLAELERALEGTIYAQGADE